MHRLLLTTIDLIEMVWPINDVYSKIQCKSYRTCIQFYCFLICWKLDKYNSCENPNVHSQYIYFQFSCIKIYNLIIKWFQCIQSYIWNGYYVIRFLFYRFLWYESVWDQQIVYPHKWHIHIWITSIKYS